MKIGVIFNCQHEGIAAGLRAMLPQAEIINFLAAVLPEATEVARAAMLNACDHLVITGMGAHHGRLSSEALLRTGRHVIMLPPFAFAGYHPDSCSLISDGAIVDGPTGGYQSRLAILGFLAGLSVADTAALYHDLAFARLGYFTQFEQESAVLAERLTACGLDGAGLLQRWTASGCFTHTINHPKIRVLLDYARFVCTRIGATPREPDPASVPDFLAAGPTHPLFPAIAARLGIPPEGCFSAGADAAGRHAGMPLMPFVAASFMRFATVPEADLLAVDGVADGLAALQLPRRPARLRLATSPMARSGAAMALMTDHGTVLRTGTPSGPIPHLGIGLSPEDAPLLLADCRDGATAQPHAALAGAQLRALPRSPCVTVWRDGAFLCAERDHPVATFSRSSAAQWERFLPLSVEEVAVLRRMLATDWVSPETGEVVARRLVHMGDSFILQFGRWRIDLVRYFPILTGAALQVVLDGELCLFQAAEPPPASVAPSALLTPGRQLTLAGSPCLLPPPVTMCDADRAWVYRRATDPAALNGCAQPAETTVRREANQRLADTGAALMPGLAARFCEDSPVGPPWMDAALRLHVLSALAPAQAAFLLPTGTAEDALAAWRQLGFNHLTFLATGADDAIAADLIWLVGASTARLPVEALTGLRDRAGVLPGGTRQIVLPGAAACGVAAAGFAAQDGSLTPARQITLMAEAGWVIGCAGEIPLTFCAPGTRVIALSDEAAFDVEVWMLAVKLGLTYGVLPCQKRNDRLLVDTNKLASLLRVMTTRL